MLLVIHLVHLEGLFVYTYNISSGALLYNLTGQNNYDFFGESIATTNNDLIVSARGYPSGLIQGAVYTFDISSGALLYNLTGQNLYDQFGSSIAMTNNYLIVYARAYPSKLSRGAVYTLIFHLELYYTI